MLNFKDDLNILITNQKYSDVDESINFTYDMSDLRLIELRNLYSLNAIAGNGSDFLKLMRITYWVANHLHFGSLVSTESFHALDVLNNTQNGVNSNCFIAATVLTECFLAMNYPARMVRCMPIDLRFNECHCMTVAYAWDEKRFIAFDSAMGGYYQDSKGRPMNISDIRKAIIGRKPFKLRSIFKTNFVNAIEQYLCKNIVRFQSHQHTKYGNEIKDGSKDVMINLNPTTIHLCNKESMYNGKTTKHIFIYNDSLFWENNEHFFKKSIIKR